MSAHPFGSPRAPGVASDEEVASSRRLGPLEVIVADDDEVTCAAVSRAVQSFGHRCRMASRGDDAWDLIRERRPDVVISDWDMPGMTGAELCRRTRVAKDDAPYTYFILMTGYNDRSHLIEGMKAGADDYQQKPIDFDELEARLLSASRVVALHRRLAEQTDRLRRDSHRFYAASRTDALTDVGNRRRLLEELEAARARATRYGHRYTVAMCDLDHFKELNDTFGHIAGDRALRRVAAAIGGALRSGDAVYRYGGEEFAVLLPEQTLEDGALAMERVRRAVERLAIPMPGLPGPPGQERVLTISVGVAELDPRTEVSVEASLAQADAALYASKERGRNRVQVIAGSRHDVHVS